VVLYLPGTNMNGEVPFDDPNHALTLYLAANGVDAWALDYRTHFVPPDTPAAGLAPLKAWNNELFESDIDEAAKFILAETHRDRIFIAGFSRGASFAYLYAAAQPKRVQGLIVLDGFVLEPGLPAVVTTKAPDSNPYADDIGGAHLTFDKRRALMELVIRDPDAPAPIPKYKSARENLEHVVYDAAAFGGKGGLANPQGGYSDAVVLAKELVTYDRWWPSVQDREHSMTPELKQSLTYSGIAVIAFASTNIAPQWSEMVKSSTALTGSTDVTMITLLNEGHLDLLVGRHAVEDVFKPVVQWIKRHPK
jgi:pimeloyl-ACP methyl ester carboxylesterase